MALITRDDLKAEAELKDSGDNALATTICDAILNLWDLLTDRVWSEQQHTEYKDVPPYTGTLFLDNYPVSSSATFEIYDDPDWEWGSDTLIDSGDYRVDYDKGIIHYNSYFSEGRQSVKVVYTAGYSSDNFPKAIKQVLVRQAVVWFRQAKQGTWDVQSVTVPAGGGGVSIERHAKGLLPEFEMMAQQERRMSA